MLDLLLDEVLAFVARYGWVAIFLYMVLETGYIIHFAPSEIVIPVAASQLVHDRFTFALFLANTTAGATLGSLLAYYVFGRCGERAIARYGRFLPVGQEDLDRGERWFRRWGEGSVFWGRLLPVVRAIISIPAGMARMGLRKFVAYSAVGSFFFNLAFTWLVYSGERPHSPLELTLLYLGGVGESALARPHVTVGFGVVLLALLGVAWTRREKITAQLSVAVRSRRP